MYAISYVIVNLKVQVILRKILNSHIFLKPFPLSLVLAPTVGSLRVTLLCSWRPGVISDPNTENYYKTIFSDSHHVLSNSVQINKI